jgi:hypothetical protein
MRSVISADRHRFGIEAILTGVFAGTWQVSWTFGSDLE